MGRGEGEGELPSLLDPFQIRLSVGKERVLLRNRFVGKCFLYPKIRCPTLYGLVFIVG